MCLTAAARTEKVPYSSVLETGHDSGTATLIRVPCEEKGVSVSLAGVCWEGVILERGGVRYMSYGMDHASKSDLLEEVDREEERGFGLIRSLRLMLLRKAAWDCVREPESNAVVN